MTAALERLEPDWPAPAGVRAATTTRHGGVSLGRYAALNLGDHVGDDPGAVARNRALLRAELRLPAEPCWLDQVHGACAVEARPGERVSADAAATWRAGVVCAVLTADCLPVLLCDDRGSGVAAAHAGWRGLAGGVLEAAVSRLDAAPDRILAWLGPAIGPDAFEVGDEVRAAFLERDPALTAAFRPSPRGRWLADLHAIARRRLASVGVERVFGGRLCTHGDGARFFSHRRDGNCGRQASLIWLES